MTAHRRLAASAALVLAAVSVSVFATVAASATTPGDNGRIAFRRYLDADHTRAAIFTVRRDGSSERRVTRPAAGVTDNQPDWSPDGRSIAFERCAPDTVCAIYIVGRDGTRLTRVSPPCDAEPPAIETKCADESRPAFMPDGRHVVFTRSTGPVDDEGFIEHSDIVIRDLSTGADRTVLRSRPFTGDNSQVVASPTGDRLAFQRENSALGTPADSTAVFVVDVDGRHLQRITPWALDAGDHPDWSPDGRSILFRSNEGGGFLDSQLFTVHPDGTHLRQITHVSADTLLLSASFSPDGTGIAYAQSGEGGLPDIFTMDASGNDIRQVTRTARWDSAPDWGSRPH